MKIMKKGLSNYQEGELLLRIVRSLAIILPLVIIIIFNKLRPFLLPDPLVISIAILYYIMRIFLPTHWYGKNKITIYMIIIDIIVCLSLPFVSGGFFSPFILFPLTVVLFAGLYFRQKYTYILTVLVSFSIIGSEMIHRFILKEDTYLPNQIYIAMLAAYVIIAFIIAWLPYVGNLNRAINVKEKTIIEERSRLSRELHDGLAQRLSSIILRMDVLTYTVNDENITQAIDEIESLKRDIRAAHNEAREIIDQLRVKIQDDPRLFTTMVKSIQDFCHNSGMTCQLHMTNGFSDLKPLATLELIRVVQEALNNIRKHSGASLIEVTFESNTDSIQVVIRDNGRGFSMGNIPKGHHGLAVMRERVECLGGSFQLSSSLGQGTTIKVIIPSSSGWLRSLHV